MRECISTELTLYQKVMSDEIGCNLAKLRDDHVMSFVIFW